MMDARSSAPEITAGDLARRVEDHEEIHVLDVRAPFRLESGRIDLVPDDRFHNVRGSDLLALADPAEAGIPRDVPVAVVCGRGNDSRRIAEHLLGRGFDGLSLAGGMVAWMALAVPRVLPAPAGWDRFVQFDRVGKGALGYVLMSAGQAIVIDPPRDTSAFVECVHAAGAKIVAVADTHAHADYVSGATALAREHGASYHLHPKDAVYPYDGTPGTIDFFPTEDGTPITVGRAALTCVHTPGHTEGSLCFRLAADVVLTGDLIFVDSVGRPDLGDRTEEWTGTLWRSLERAKREWPETARIYPAHYSSDAERNADRTIGTALGELLESNAPLRIADEAEFTAWVLERTGSFPDAYRTIKSVNVGLQSLGAGELDELEAGKNQCALG